MCESLKWFVEQGLTHLNKCRSLTITSSPTGHVEHTFSLQHSLKSPNYMYRASIL